MSVPRTYRVHTLGCKLNQSDSAAIAGQLRARGFAPASENETPGVVIINTCTVTAASDREARRLMRRSRRDAPDCRIVVTGCYAERDRRALEATPGIDAIVGHSDRARVPEILDKLAEEAEPGSADDLPACREAEDLPWADFGERTRALLKIQDGCDLPCSYCIIPRVRGASRSVDPATLESALTRLAARGYAEIVLTGVNTGAYGRDLTPRASLDALLDRLVKVQGLGRLRLNSLEPRTVTAPIVARLAGDARLARHLQIPLQSGSDPVLRRMRRNYGTDDYRALLERLRAAVPEIGLGADVIAGFPGETDAAFEETCRYIEASPLNYLHVFSYSDRPGTAASAMDGHVPEPVAHERAARLRALGAARAAAFRRAMVGRTLPTLILRERLADGRQRGLTDNFLDVAIAAAPASIGTIVPATIVAADGARAVAEPAASH